MNTGADGRANSPNMLVLSLGGGPTPSMAAGDLEKKKEVNNEPDKNLRGLVDFAEHN